MSPLALRGARACVGDWLWLWDAVTTAEREGSWDPFEEYAPHFEYPATAFNPSTTRADTCHFTTTLLLLQNAMSSLLCMNRISAQHRGLRYFDSRAGPSHMAISRHREAVAELDVCIEETRRIRGHEYFLLSQTAAKTQEHAATSTIVVVNIAGFRSDAIIVSRSLLRCFWIGTGLASSMPLHAARTHVPSSTENTFSRAISSYAPSIKTLGHALQRERATENLQGPLLIATMPTTPGDGPGSDSRKPPDLDGVTDEEKQVSNIAGRHLPIERLDLPSVEVRGVTS
ncbi:hypothetical protein GGR58DRAFT_504894 [Xylaria digitata]|nr:hypothetical protein GGR58DRAFT_504894 [Xylaria digitata]